MKRRAGLPFLSTSRFVDRSVRLQVEVLELRAVPASIPGFQFPIAAPLAGSTVTQEFGEGFGGASTQGHLGTDFSGAQGTAVYAAADGVIARIYNAGTGWDQVILIKHDTLSWGWDKDVVTMYAHITPVAGLVEGQQVARGTKIATVGPTAAGSTGPHLHFELRSGNDASRLAGPGYTHVSFDRTVNRTMQVAGYNMIWYDPHATLLGNLAIGSASVGNTNARPGDVQTVNWQIASSALPKTGPGSTIDLSKVSVTVSIPSLAVPPVDIQPSSIDPKTGAGAHININGDLEGTATFVIPTTTSPGNTYMPVMSAKTGAGSSLTVQGTSLTTVQAPLAAPLTAFQSYFGAGATDAAVRSFTESLYPNLHNTLSYLYATGLLDNRVVEMGDKIGAAEQALVTGSAQSFYQSSFPSLVSLAFGSEATLRTWDYRKPTVILVHGIMTSLDNELALSQAYQTAVGTGANIIAFDWGFTLLDNGLDRTMAAVLNKASNPALIGVQDRWLLQGAVDLNELIALVNRAYASAGVSNADKVNVVAHSEGTVLTTAALSMASPGTAPAWILGKPQVNEVVFVGANLHRGATDNGQEIGRIQATINRGMINFYSKDDGAVNLLAFGSEVGGGLQGFNDINNAQILSVDAENLAHRTITVSQPSGKVKTLTDIGITHIGGTNHLGPYGNTPNLQTPAELLTSYEAISGPVDPTSGPGSTLDLGKTTANTTYIGWWNWLLNKQYGENYLLKLIGAGGATASTTPTTTVTTQGYGPSQADFDLGSKLVVPSGPQFDLPPSGLQIHAAAPDPAKPQSSPLLVGAAPSANPIFRGDALFAIAQSPSDVDGDLARADIFEDKNADGYPEHDEYLGSRAYTGGTDIRVPIDTMSLQAGVHTFLVQAVDSLGNRSTVGSFSVSVSESGAAPPALPAHIDFPAEANYSIIPHRNGDISYDPADYVIGPGHLDTWEITPENGGAFVFDTTGSTDTAIGLYDKATGNRIAFDQDSGSNNLAHLITQLTTGHSYVLAVVSERNSAGNYGLNVTGINQTIEATASVPSPLYAGTVSGAIAQTYSDRYFDVLAPNKSNKIDLLLRNASTLDGFIRIEDQNHMTVATSFLAGTGYRDILHDIPIVGGQYYYITVSGMYGTTGGFSLDIDFNPDDPDFPDQLFPLPPSPIPLVPLPDGSLTTTGETLTAPGQVRYYLVSPEQAGTYSFETRGGLHAQMALYVANGSFVQKDNGSVDGRNSRLSLSLTANDYILAVRAESGQVGQYDLVMSGPPDAPGTLTPQGLAFTADASPDLFGNRRYIHYKIVAPASTTTLALNDTPVGSTLDVWMRLSDSDDNILATVNAAGPGVAEQITNQAIVGGKTYYVTLYGFNRTTGSTNLHADFDPDFQITTGSEFPVNTTFASKEFPAVARNTNGIALVTWAYQRPSDGNYLVLAQRFATDGTKLGNEFTLNTSTIPSTPRSRPAVAPDGTFVVAWERGSDIVIRRFDASANPIGGETKVNGTESAGSPRLTMDGGGGFIVAWSSFNHGDPNGDVYFRRFNADGSVAGPETRANTTTVDYQDTPDVAIRPNGNFMVVWLTKPVSSQNLQILGQAFDASGNKVGLEIPIGAVQGVNQDSPRIVSDPNSNRSIVVWRDGNTNIRGRLFINDFQSSGTDFIVNTKPQSPTNSAYLAPDVAFASQGKFLVTWVTTDSSGSGIAAQPYGVDGLPNGPELLLNQTTSGDQQAPAAASDGVKNVLVVWSNVGSQAASYAVRGVTYVFQPIQEPRLVVTDSLGASDDAFLDYGAFRVGATSRTGTVSITNSGNSVLALANLQIVGADAASFSLDAASNVTLQPGQSKTLSVSFNPVKAGHYYASLRFTHNQTSNQLGGTLPPSPFAMNLEADVPTPPVVATAQVNPNIRNTSLSGLVIGFDKPVTGNVGKSLSLTRNGGPNLFPASPSISSSDQTTYSLSGLAGLTTDSGDYVFSIKAAGSGILDALGNPLQNDASTTFSVDNVAPTVSISSVTPLLRGTPVNSLTITFSEPVTGFSLANLTLSRDGGANLLTPSQTLTTSDNVTFTLAGLTSLTAAQGHYTLTLTATGSGITDIAGNPLAATVTTTWQTVLTLAVSSMTQTTGGVVIHFTRPFDPSTLNLYDTATAGFGPADVTLVGAATGPVRGSLIVAPDNQTVTFMKTGAILPPDTYTVTLRSATNGFKDVTGNLLDGDANNVTGDNYTTTFTVASSSARVVSIPDFARGPGQSVNVPANATGLPIHISDAAGLLSADFSISYDPTLLTITAAAPGPGTPSNALVTINTSTPGVVILSYRSTTAMAAGPADFIILTASVPANAPYASKEVLDIFNLSLNANQIASQNDDAVHVNAYFGDTTGNGGYSGLDSSRTQRVIALLDSGYDAYQLLDPVIISDITGNGSLSSLDAARIRQFVALLNPVEIPGLPVGVTPSLTGGPDPRVSLPRDLAAQVGQTIKVPLRLEQTSDHPIDIASYDFLMRFDPAVLQVGAVTAGDLGTGFAFSSSVDAATGLLVISASSATALTVQPGTTGVIFWIELTIKPGAPAGAVVLNLLGSQSTARTGVLTTSLNEGGLTLFPAPTNAGDDTVDGVLIIKGASVPDQSPTKIMSPTVIDRVLETIAPPASASMSSLFSLAAPVPVAMPVAAVQVKLNHKMTTLRTTHEKPVAKHPRKPNAVNLAETKPAGHPIGSFRMHTR